MWGRSWFFVSWNLKLLPALEKYIAPDLFWTSCQHVNLSSSEHKAKKGTFSSPAPWDKAQIPVSYEGNSPASQTRVCSKHLLTFQWVRRKQTDIHLMKPGWLPARSLWGELRLGVRVSGAPTQELSGAMWCLSKQVSTIYQAEKKCLQVSGLVTRVSKWKIRKQERTRGDTLGIECIECRLQAVAPGKYQFNAWTTGDSSPSYGKGEYLIFTKSSQSWTTLPLSGRIPSIPTS